MTCFNLSDRLLTRRGILARLREIDSSLDKIPQEKRNDTYRKKLESIRKDLRSIFFEGLDDSGVQAFLLSPNSPFNPDYPGLAQALLSVFSEQPLSGMITHIEGIKQGDWQPEETDLVRHFNRLNDEHRYFESNEALMALYKALVVSSREVCVLIERNNTPSNTMAYDYAYKLMAVLVDKSKPLPSVEQLSKQVESLLKPKDTALKRDMKYFHDHLLDLRLPKPQHDREGWLSFIQKNGAKALGFFSMAERMEEKLGRAPKTFKEAQDVEALLTYARASEDIEWAKLCSIYQVPEATFNSGLDYIGSPPVWPKKLRDTIPSLTIEQAPYIWTKLSASDKRGLILGEITHCCQSIGDDSSQCVKDATSLNDNALYVLLKRRGETSNPIKHPDGSINDQDYQVIGQSYVWKSKRGNLCLDSVECVLESIQPDELHGILSAFGEQVLQYDTSVKRVTLGTGGKTPKHLFAEEAKIPEKISQGFFYGDATNQYLISKIPSRLTEAQIQALRATYSVEFCDVLFYLSDYLADTTNLPNEIAALITRYPNLPDVLTIKAVDRLLDYTLRPTLADLEYIDFDALQPTDTDSEISYISTARLMWQADTPEKIIKALPHIHPKDRLAVVKEKDPEGYTILHSEAENPESLQVILSLLPESDRLAALKEKDNDGWTVLHSAATSPESLRVILSFLPESDRRLAALKEKDNRGWTLLHRAAENPESLRVILPLYPTPEERLAAVKEKDQSGYTVLHRASENPESLEKILSLYPTPKDRLAAVKEKDGAGWTVLHRTTTNPGALEEILSLYPTPKDRLAAVKEKDGLGWTVLHRAAANPESLQVILALYPEPEGRLAALKEKTKSGWTVLHSAAESPESLRVILELYRTPEERLAAVREKNKSDWTVLHCATKSPESLQVILSSLSLSDVMILGSENPFIHFTVLQNVIITKARELDYTPEQLISLGNTKDIGALQTQLNIFAQSKLKERLAREDEGPVSEPQNSL